MSIADNIRELRTKYDLTQQQLGEIAGVSDKAVSTWESGANVPRMGAIEKMARHFNVPKGAIIDDEPLSSNNNLIGARLKECRTESKMTQEEVLTALKQRFDLTVARETLSKWENSHQEPSSYPLVCLARLYGTTAEYIIVGEKKDAPTHDAMERGLKELGAIKPDGTVDFEKIELLANILRAAGAYKSEKDS